MTTKTIHGIDLYAPGGVAALLEYHRAMFGDAQMNANAGAGGGEGAEAPAAGAEPPAAEPNGSGQGESAPAENEAGTRDSADSTQEPGAPEPWADPAAARAEIERLRAENGRARVNAKEQAAQEARDALVQDLGKALGLVPAEGEEAPDAEALTRAATEKEAEAKQARLELAVYRAAATAGGNPESLLDSRKFLAALEGLDPSDGEAVTKAVKTALADNPTLRATQAAARSGAEFSGGTGEKRTTANSLTEAVAGYYAN